MTCGGLSGPTLSAELLATDGFRREVESLWSVVGPMHGPLTPLANSRPTVIQMVLVKLSRSQTKQRHGHEKEAYREGADRSRRIRDPCGEENISSRMTGNMVDCSTSRSTRAHLTLVSTPLCSVPGESLMTNTESCCVTHC